MAEEFTALCPTCGGLPVDHGETTKLRAALTEALALAEQAARSVVIPGPSAHGNAAFARAAFNARISELRKEFGPC